MVLVIRIRKSANVDHYQIDLTTPGPCHTPGNGVQIGDNPAQKQFFAKDATLYSDR